MEILSVNKLFKEYKHNGGTMSFKDFVDKHNRKKNASGDESISNMFHNAIGQDVMNMFGEKPVKEEAKVVSFKGADGGVSTGAVNPADNMTFGINNYVIIGTVVIIVGAIGLNYYLKHKKENKMAESNKLTNILLGAAIVGLGYAIYQTYPNEITANAESIKNKFKGLFGKKTKGDKTDSTCANCKNSTCNCGVPKDAQKVNIYVQEEAWNDLPEKLSTDVIRHYDIDNSIGQQAMNRITGNQPTRQ